MSVFADASALVKLYADEAGHEVVRSLQDVVIAEVSRVEVASALWRKTRTGELSDDDVALLVADFEADYHGSEREPRRFEVITTTAPLLEDAALLCARHGLRAYDAVQLATALAAVAAGGRALAMAAFDRQLRSAAVREGLAVVPT